MIRISLDMCTTRFNYTINHDPKTLVIVLEETMQNKPTMLQVRVSRLLSTSFGS